MTTALHFITPSVYPAPGGMQESVLRIAKGMAACGFECFIYTLRQPPEHAGIGLEEPGVEVVPLEEDFGFLLDPLSADSQEHVAEGEENRMMTLCLRHAVETRLRTRSGGRDVLISFYASQTGFLAQHAAMGLGVAHVASVRGSDFSRDLLATGSHWKLRFVAENATQIVTTNREQADGLSAIFRVRQPIRSIHNSIEDCTDRPYWKAPPMDRIRLFSDGGFSLKKGTHLLLRAVERLIELGLPVDLTLLGGVFFTEDEQYWDRQRQDYLDRHPGRFRFPGHQASSDVDDALRQAHLYCSATLAEGCSISRIRALTLGIPIVTTRCGALVEVTDGCGHVRLCSPGDWRQLSREIELAIADLRQGALVPERACVDGWRKHFSVEREREEWRSVIESVLDG